MTEPGTVPYVAERPQGRPVMRMRWLHLLFIHWPVPAESLRPLIPEGLEIDTFDGRAWVGLIPFTMRDVSPVILPRLPWRGVTDFNECNVRTYVFPRGRPELRGVWFFSLDAASRWGVWAARRFWRLNYIHAEVDVQPNGDTVRQRVKRRGSAPVEMRAAWRLGAPLPPSKPGELAHFLTERYCLYSCRDGGPICRGCIWHEPWPLRQADLLELDDQLVKAAGIELDQSTQPVVFAADALRVKAWRIAPI